MAYEDFIRGTATALRNSIADHTTLSVESKAGDTVIILACAQFGQINARPPEGFEGQHGATNNRGWYIAHRKVTDPSQTVNVDPWQRTQAGGRERAVMYVLKGEFTLSNATFETELPQPDNPYGLTLYAAWTNAAKTQVYAGYESSADSIRTASGEASTEASWSILDATFTDTNIQPNTGVARGATPQCWAAISLTPVKFSLEDKPTVIKESEVLAVKTAEMHVSSAYETKITFDSIPADSTIILVTFTTSWIGNRNTLIRVPLDFEGEVKYLNSKKRNFSTYSYVAYKHFAEEASNYSVAPFGLATGGTKKATAYLIKGDWRPYDINVIAYDETNLPSGGSPDAPKFICSFASEVNDIIAKAADWYTVSNIPVTQNGQSVGNTRWSRMDTAISNGYMAPLAQPSPMRVPGYWLVANLLRVGDNPAPAPEENPIGNFAPYDYQGVPLQAGLVDYREEFRGTDMEPLQLNLMPYGCRTVTELIFKPGFIVAHRGGSFSWPEGTMFAYTNSVAHGADALEVSTHKTKDGVWVVVHDAKLTRIIPGAPDKNLWELTWDEIKHLTIGGFPIAKAQEVIDAYYGSHVLVLDPKYSASDWQGLEALLPNDGKRQERVIWKSAGDAGWLANQFHTKKYKCWGYMYSQHAGAESETWKDYWDFLGYPYEADQAGWTIMKSYKKPVWAHICPNKEAYKLGLSKGADACMVAGIADLLPTSA